MIQVKSEKCVYVCVIISYSLNKPTQPSVAKYIFLLKKTRHDVNHLDRGDHVQYNMMF